MIAVEVIDNAAAATAALDPIRNRLLAEMKEPMSASALAQRVGIPRQKVNYHLRTLEAHGLARLAKERTWGGITERLMVASASSYVVSPSTLGAVAVDLDREKDRLSGSYLIALAARAVREVGQLVRRAAAAEKPLATLSVDTEIRFRSAADRAAFTHELTQAITSLASRYHVPDAPDGRDHRLVVLAHPTPKQEKESQ
jgi:predicted ArsR family transcriptional regulator